MWLAPATSPGGFKQQPKPRARYQQHRAQSSACAVSPTASGANASPSKPSRPARQGWRWSVGRSHVALTCCKTGAKRRQRAHPRTQRGDPAARRPSARRALAPRERGGLGETGEGSRNPKTPLGEHPWHPIYTRSKITGVELTTFPIVGFRSLDSVESIRSILSFWVGFDSRSGLVANIFD